MKKYLNTLIILIMVVVLSACTHTEKNPSISEPVVAKSVDENTSRPIAAASQFSPSDPVIYFTMKVTDLPAGTKLKAVWKYIKDGTEIPSVITSEGSGYEAFTLKRSSNEFPSGEYEVTVNTQVDGKSMEVKGKFNILSEAKPVHLSNPLTSKAVDNDDMLNPTDIISSFKQSDKIIYFIIQSKDLPIGTKVTCLWYYVDTGDSLSHELATDGNRNIAFSLKPDEGKLLPVGKYVVTATVVINGETESVSKEFEITNLL